MVVGIFVSGFYFTDRQLVVEKFDQEGAMQELFLQGLAMS
jgi:hypothetical protein